MTSSELIENTEEREKILHRPIVQKKFPSNPKDVFKEFKSLKKEQIIKLSLSAVIIILFGVFNNVRVISSPQPENKCYFDVVHSWFTPLNYFYRGNKNFRAFLMIVAGLLLDITFLFSFIAWSIYAVDWRFGVNMLLFYGIRYLANETERLSVPNLMHFEYPGFPSIVVGYVPGDDFFFSGHCGFPMVNMMEYIWLRKYWLAAFCAFTTSFEMFLMLSNRGHYIVDIIVGIVFGQYISIHGRNWVKFIYDHIEFLNKLKMNNRKELKRIKVDWDIGD